MYFLFKIICTSLKELRIKVNQSELLKDFCTFQYKVGRGAVVECLLWVQEVPGSNPSNIYTFFSFSNQESYMQSVLFQGGYIFHS